MVRTTAVDKSGPGMNAGLMSISNGAPTRPRPKPTEPWSVAPRRTAKFARIMSVQDNIGTARVSVSKWFWDVVSCQPWSFTYKEYSHQLSTPRADG